MALDPRWRHFSKQAPALEHADSLPPEAQAQVWSLELDHGKGKRSYIVANRSAFWQRYRGLHPRARHYYEIIRTSQPCHLYFDLEYSRATNPESRGEQMVATLCVEIRRFLSEQYDGRHSVARIVDLDSTTAEKFSRHLVVRLDGAAFADNSHVGRFVHGLLSSLVMRREVEPRVAALFVAPPASSRKPRSAAHVCFVDQSVYSRNRCFRLCTPLGPSLPRLALPDSTTSLCVSQTSRPKLGSKRSCCSPA